MPKSIYPKFAKGRVLKKESLDVIRDFPRDFVQLTYEKYSDGVIHGFDINVSDNMVYITKGAIKHKGEIIIAESGVLDFNLYGKNVCVKMKIKEQEETEDFKTIGIEYKIDMDYDLKENEIELGRLNLSEGAILRKDYTGVSDFKTQYNTLDITNVLYASMGQATIAPKLLKKFAETLLKSSASNPYDISFAFTCLNSDVIHSESINCYLSRRLNYKGTKLTNDEIYKSLVMITRGR